MVSTYSLIFDYPVFDRILQATAGWTIKRFLLIPCYCDTCIDHQFVIVILVLIISSLLMYSFCHLTHYF
uniref:Ovule protein n=1 Tax=Romanomermis culicivorax TaxID=13658 RepID=A0A915L3B0_ROMCU